MALKVNHIPDAQTARNIKADILLSISGSYAAVEALMFAAAAHREQAARDADTEMAEYWLKIVEILSDAKLKIAEVK